MVPTSTVRLVKLRGDLDLEMIPSASRLLHALDVAVIDMRTVTYLDSTALGMLIAARERIAGRGGVVRIVSSDPRLRRLLKVTGIEKSVSVYEDLKAALETPR